MVVIKCSLSSEHDKHLLNSSDGQNEEQFALFSDPTKQVILVIVEKMLLLVFFLWFP